MFTKFFVFILCIFFIINAENKDAMFGLSWGMSPKQIKQMGITIVKTEGDRNLYLYKCDSLPKNVSMAEGYSLTFDEDSSLIKIIMLSKNIENDPYGTYGKEKFDAMVELLKKKYTIDNTYCYTGRELYEESDEFYECLKYPGCGSWTTFFSSENKIISIELHGLQRGIGYIRIAVESIPDFSNAFEKYQSKKNSEDGEAF